MHYSLENLLEHRNHGLKHNPFKALVAPRPIGWIGTISKAGVFNLAPYSFFNAVCDAPPIVMFSSAGRKDSLTNVEDTGRAEVGGVDAGRTKSISRNCCCISAMSLCDGTMRAMARGTALR